MPTQSKVLNFHQPLLYKVGDRQYLTDIPYRIEWVKSGTHCRLTIPENFGTDIATIPRGWIMGTTAKVLGFDHDGPHRAGAVAHDGLYFTQGFRRHMEKPEWVNAYQILKGNKWITPHGTWSREDCDDFFLMLMEAADVPQWKRTTMYRAVRIGGESYWKS